MEINNNSKIKKNKDKLFSKININHNGLSNHNLDISRYHLYKTKLYEGKINNLKKLDILPINFYISSINKVYNNTDRSVNISQQNSNNKSLNGRKLNYYFKNKLIPIISNNNNTYEILEPNYTFSNNHNTIKKKDRNSLKKYILNYKIYFDNVDLNKIRISKSLIKSNDIFSKNQLYFNKKIFSNFRSHSGENKNKYLSLIRNERVSKKNKSLINKQNLINFKDKNESNNNFKINNQFINNNLHRKRKINLKKKNLNKNLMIEDIIKNNRYFPYTCRGKKEKSLNIKNYKMNQFQTYNNNTLYSKVFEDKKKLNSFFSILKNEINNENIDKCKKEKKPIFDYFSKDQTKYSKINKKINNNTVNIKLLDHEACLTYRKININNNKYSPLFSENNINQYEKDKRNSHNMNKNKDFKNNKFPLIYKKRIAFSPLVNKKCLSSFFLKKEEAINSGRETRNKLLDSNITLKLNKDKIKYNLNKIFAKKQKIILNKKKINKNIKNMLEANQSKSCYKISEEPNMNFSSEINITNQKGKKQEKILYKNEYFFQNLLNNENNKNKKIEIKKNSSICKGGEYLSYEQKKVNQDNLFKTKFDDLDISFYSVCDGHGDCGHLISEFIKTNLPLIVYKEIRSLFYLINNDSKNNNIDNKNEEKTKAYFSEIYKQSFDITNKKLISNKNIDSSLSGSTCVSLLFYENLIISANLGDSRAIMGKLKDNKWNYELLSRDHKPSEIDEALRIKYKNGKIHPYLNEDGKFSGPKRVWIKGQGIPGLAMTRSFGDIIGSTVGIISEPEIKIFKYEKENKFIIIGSDGLWEYISCQEAVNIVGNFFQDNNLDSDSAVIKLFQIARNKWSDNNNYIDDISIIILFLD